MTFYLEHSNKMDIKISYGKKYSKIILENLFLVSYVHKAWKVQLKLCASKCYNITFTLLNQPGNSCLGQPRNSLKAFMFNLPYWLTKLTNIDGNLNNIYNTFAE